MKPENAKEIIEATSALPTVAWVSIIIIGIIVVVILAIINLDKISSLLFGDKKGILNKSKADPLPITTYISGWYTTIRFSESMKLSNLENLLDFLKKIVNDFKDRQISSKKIILDLSDTDKVNSTAIKDITSFIEVIISDNPGIELIIELKKEPSEQLKLAYGIWNSLVESFKVGGRNDINVTILCNK